MSVFSPDSVDQVKLAYTKMFQDNPSADHIAMACKVNGQEAFNDNGEFGSGVRILRAIQASGLDNVALYMTRQYGGVNLGPRRFKIMTDLAELALEKLDDMRNRRPSPHSSPPSPATSPSSSSQHNQKPPKAPSAHSEDDAPIEHDERTDEAGQDK